MTLLVEPFNGNFKNYKKKDKPFWCLLQPNVKRWFYRDWNNYERKGGNESGMAKDK